ncbi:unnamed protein product [Peniophora sp. CBMAI 1063]|nr:unnamed protein product [Peniophora sp. CBMAI 1063]
MIAIQLPAAAPHVLYTNIPATTRRAANIPFLAGVRANPPQTQQSPRATRRAPPPPAPRRRNAISYHPSQNENPFADPVNRPARASANPTWSEPSPKRSPSPPEPRTPRKATLLSSGHMTDVAEPLRFSPPPKLAPARDQTCRLVASLLLNRASRSRPMCGRTRRCAPGRSRLATCVILEDAA